MAWSVAMKALKSGDCTRGGGAIDMMSVDWWCRRKWEVGEKERMSAIGWKKLAELIRRAWRRWGDSGTGDRQSSPFIDYSCTASEVHVSKQRRRKSPMKTRIETDWTVRDEMGKRISHCYGKDVERRNWRRKSNKERLQPRKKENGKVRGRETSHSRIEGRSRVIFVGEDRLVIGELKVTCGSENKLVVVRSRWKRKREKTYPKRACSQEWYHREVQSSVHRWRRW